MELIIDIDEELYEDAVNDMERDTLSLGIYLIERVKNGKPLKTGHWIMQGLSPYEGFIRCSECDAVYDIKRVFKYCPNCGAKMEGENNATR